MKNLIFPGLFMLLFSLLSTAGFGQQKPASSTTPQKLLPCEEAVKAARKANQVRANAECRTVFQCVECIDSRSKEKTCKSLSVQPDKKSCLNASEIPQNINIGTSPSDKQTVVEPFGLEIIQNHCYNGGVSLEAIVPTDGQSNIDGKAQATMYSFLWEIDGGKGGHAAVLNCVTGKKATVRVTKLSSGEAVTRVVNLSGSSVQSAKATSKLVAAYRKTSCFGVCPAYEVQIFDDGLVTWNGIMNTGTPGKARKQMDKSEVTKVQEKAALTNFFSMNDHYPDYPIVDASATIIYMSGNTKEKQVTAITGAPKGFYDLEQHFKELIATNGWLIEPKGAASKKNTGQNLDSKN